MSGSAVSTPPYTGRFAPAPTGPLHFGSAVAAIASFAQARSRMGRWLVRMEDLDSPRNVPGADRLILDSLSGLGLEWDGVVLYQSQRLDAYAAALSRLQHDGLLFPCACTRRETAGAIYPGTCRAGLPVNRHARSVRIRVPDTRISFADAVQGMISQRLFRDVGDFIVKRADGQYAYHLAIVVDDGYQQVSEIVRGADLLESSPRQIFLQQALGLKSPSYAHMPLVLDTAGRKLSKQNRAPALDLRQAASIWLAALQFLGQEPPFRPGQASAGELRDWAIANWSLQKIPGVASKTLADAVVRDTDHAPT